jgi:beta-galactosidase
MSSFTRRHFVLGSGATAALSFVPGAAHSAIAQGCDAAAPQCSVRLDEGWQFRQGPLSGIWEAWRAEESDLWKNVSIPHCFNGGDAVDPDSTYYRGQGWYRTHLQIRNPLRNGRTLLHFQGSGQTTTVWVGSKLIGLHKGGYDEFVFDITDSVADIPAKEAAAGIPVAVLCDNGPDLERVPSDLSDFCLYGGLYRHVNLVYVPAVSLNMVHIQPGVEASGSARVTVTAQLYNPQGYSGPCRMAVRVTDRDGNVVHTAAKELPAWSFLSEITGFTIPTPSRWSPESPYLYQATVTLTTNAGESHLEDRFGIRSLEFVEHGPFKLNGKRVLLRGTQRHVDHAGFAAAMPDDLVRQEMQMIRDMGANFIRLAHYQQDRLVLDLCDELGLMVWEEAPWCRAGEGDDAFKTNAKGMLTNMIQQHFNHPSVILWGLGNEDDWPDEYPSVDQQAIRQFMTEMRDLAHSLDNSRLTSFRRCDFARDIPDVYSPSIWAGWYRGNYHEYEQSLLTERNRVKHFIHIEWGADSQAGRHAEDPDAILHKVATGLGTEERGLAYLKTGGEVRVSSDGDWSETYACDLFDWHLKTQEKLDWLTGAAQWIFKDFASPLRADNGVPNVNQKGLVERDFRKKESFYVFQSYWSDKPMVHIYGHSWPVRWGEPGQKRTVKVYSNCESAELFLNGRSMGARRRDSQDFPAAGLRWDVAFNAGKNQLRVVAKKGDVTVTDQIECEYQTRQWKEPARFDIVEANRNNDVVTVEAKLYDKEGVLCLDSRRSVRFSIAGQGALIDNLGTVRGSHLLQLSNGRAEISIKRKGNCIVAIASDGLPPAFCNIS